MIVLYRFEWEPCGNERVGSSDGIFSEREQQLRPTAVQPQMIQLLAERRQNVVFGSPPATGKTKLLQLITRQLRDSTIVKKIVQKVLQIHLDTSLSVAMEGI